MDAIFKKDNVYVILIDIGYDKEEQVFSDPSFVVAGSDKTKCSLYGGRVYVERDSKNYSVWYIDIDGIAIKRFFGSEFEPTTKHDLEQICAFLNQIENLGVDTFLENYKKSLMSLKQELITMSEKYEQELAASEDEGKKKVLGNIRAVIRSIVCMLFVLSINLNAGLDNHQYINAYEEVANIYL